jgi:GMP synthase (glutamine-hydrolysing)
LPAVTVVNNYFELSKVQELVGSLRSNGADVSVLDWKEATAANLSKASALVLSGSPAMLSEADTRAKFAHEIDAIRGVRAPLLGICFGIQLMGLSFGSEVLRAEKNTRMYVSNDVVREDEVFDGLPRKVSVFESHLEYIDRVPEGFELTATSPTSPVGAVRHRELPLVGFQFHPERNDEEHPDGDSIVRNFVSGLRR